MDFDRTNVLLNELSLLKAS